MNVRAHAVWRRWCSRVPDAQALPDAVDRLTDDGERWRAWEASVSGRGVPACDESPWDGAGGGGVVVNALPQAAGPATVAPERGWGAVGEAEALGQLQGVARNLTDGPNFTKRVLHHGWAAAAEEFVAEMDVLKVDGAVVGGQCYEYAVWFIGVVCRCFPLAMAVAEEALARGVTVTEGLVLQLAAAGAKHLRRWHRQGAKEIPPERLFAAVWNVAITGDVPLSPEYGVRYLAVLLRERVGEACLFSNFRYLQENHLLPWDALGTAQVYETLWNGTVSPDAYRWLSAHVAREGVPDAPALLRAQMRAAGRAGQPADAAALFYERYPAVLGRAAAEFTAADYSALFSAYAFTGEVHLLEGVLADMAVPLPAHIGTFWGNLVAKHVVADPDAAEALIARINARAGV